MTIAVVLVDNNTDYARVAEQITDFDIALAIYRDTNAVNVLKTNTEGPELPQTAFIDATSGGDDRRGVQPTRTY